MVGENNGFDMSLIGGGAEIATAIKPNTPESGGILDTSSNIKLADGLTQRSALPAIDNINSLATLNGQDISPKNADMAIDSISFANAPDATLSAGFDSKNTNVAYAPDTIDPKAVKSDGVSIDRHIDPTTGDLSTDGAKTNEAQQTIARVNDSAESTSPSDGPAQVVTAESGTAHSTAAESTENPIFKGNLDKAATDRRAELAAIQNPNDAQKAELAKLDKQYSDSPQAKVDSINDRIAKGDQAIKPEEFQFLIDYNKAKNEAATENERNAPTIDQTIAKQKSELQEEMSKGVFNKEKIQNYVGLLRQQAFQNLGMMPEYAKRISEALKNVDVFGNKGPLEIQTYVREKMAEFGALQNSLEPNAALIYNTMQNTKKLSREYSSAKRDLDKNGKESKVGQEATRKIQDINVQMADNKALIIRAKHYHEMLDTKVNALLVDIQRKLGNGNSALLFVKSMWYKVVSEIDEAKLNLESMQNGKGWSVMEEANWKRLAGKYAKQS